MIVGNLPLIDSLNDDDILICSDDGQHTKRIKMSGLRRSGGKGLVYWVEDEHSITRVLVNDGSTEFDDRFTVPGKAKMMVEVLRKNEFSIDELLVQYENRPNFQQFTREPVTNKYIAWYGEDPEDPESWDSVVIDHDPEDHIDKFSPLSYYYLERLSNKPVMGGACAFKIWGNVDYSSRLPSATVRYGDSLTFTTHDCYVPFWLLMSENPDNLMFQFVRENALTGEKTVIQTVEALEDFTVTFNGMEFYVNGYVDPELYESHAIWNSFPTCYIYDPETGQDTHIYRASGEPYGIYTPNPYYTAVYKVDPEQNLYNDYDVCVGSWFYKDALYTPTSDSRYLHMKPSKGTSYMNEADWVREPPVTDYNRASWVSLTYQYNQSTTLDKLKVYSIKWGNKNNDQYYTDQYEFFGESLPWLGCVGNITGIYYDSPSGGKDATSYIFHDANITVPHYYYTGIEDGRRVVPSDGKYQDFVFYSGISDNVYDENQGVPHSTILGSNIKIDRLGYIYAKGLYLDDMPVAGIEGIQYHSVSGDSTVVADYTIDGTQNYISAPITTYDALYDATTGVKVGTISCNGTNYDVYAPNGGGGGGSNVSVSNLWTPDPLESSKKIVTLTVNGTGYDIYSPDTTIADMTVTPDYNSGTRLARITTVNSSTGAVTNNDIYLPSSGSTFGCQTGRLTQDSVGHSLSTTGGPYTITVDGLKTTSNGSTAFKFAKGLWKFDVRLVWTLKSTEVFSAHGVENIILAVTSKSNAGVWYAGTVFPSDPKTRYFVSPMYAGESNIVIDIPLSCALNVASAQLQAPSFTLQITHDKWSTAYEVSHIDWSVVAYKIGEYN